MANRNIQMNYYNGSGYDVLYPETVMNQVSGLNSSISSLQGSISSLQSSLNNKLNIGGGTMTGGLTLNGDPTGNLMAATKQYVDNLASNLGESYSTEILSTTATDTGQLTVVSSFSMVKWVIGILTRPQLSVKAFYFYFGAAVRFGFFENRNNNLYYTALDNFHSILLSGDNQIILAEVDTDLLTSGAQVSFAVLGYK